MQNQPWLIGLNKHQNEAVTAPQTNLLILAGAGSGKTRVLVSRIAWLMDAEELSPHAVLAVTFTNKAAGEMKHRLRQLIASPVEGLWFGTFHGLCNRLLRRHHQEAHLPAHFHILDSDDQARMIKRILAELRLDTEQWPIKQAQSFINGNKDEGRRAAHVQVQAYGPGRTLLKIYQAYEQACRTAGVVDFAELLLRTHELLRDNAALLLHYQQRFRAILVDEFQDTNTIQYAWIRLLAGDQTSVMVVGDDDQSIYGWRGAKVENIQRFLRDFNPVRVIRLEQNYRSTSTILNAANALIANNDARMGKNLWTDGKQGELIILFKAFNELEEARFVSERIAMELQNGRAANEIAILYRSNAQSRVLEESLLRAEIAYRIHGGVRFFERAEIKDALGYMRLIINTHDVAAFERVVNLPTRGIGEKTLTELRAFAREKNCSLWQAAESILANQQLPNRAARALGQFLNLITQLQQQTLALDLSQQMNTIIQQSGLYAHYAKRKGDQAESKLENLQELVNAGKQFQYDQEEQDLPLLSSFLAHAALEAGEMQAHEHERHVHLMTLHAAKGLEFPVVFLVGMEEGVFPASPEPSRLEEERRLCYVGITRAMEKLIVSYAEVRRKYGREEYHQPSRFLREIPTKWIEEIRPKARFQMTPSRTSSIEVLHEAECGFRLGQLVNHAKFGQGVILAIEGSGPRTRVQVRFSEEHGSKWLVLAYANLVA